MGELEADLSLVGLPRRLQPEGFRKLLVIKVGKCKARFLFLKDLSGCIVANKYERGKATGQ